MFDLEQKIMSCWIIIDDLKIARDNPEHTVEILDGLIRLYDIKFDELFKVFEQSIRNK